MLSQATISRSDAQRVLAQRALARRYLVDFSHYISHWWQPARHVRLLAEKLERVERFIATKGKEGTGRLMVFMPPRHGKTEMVSKHFPAWMLGRNPDSRIILASYGADLAVDNSRKVREIVTSVKYQAVFGELASRRWGGDAAQGEGMAGGERAASVLAAIQLSSDSRAAQAWDLASPNRGGLVAAGVGGGITGKGAHLLVIDDPFKNRDEAESEAHRERVYDWYKSSAYTRLEDGGAVVLMHTRWHQEDLAGKLLMQMANDMLADRFEVLCLPDVYEPVQVPETRSAEDFQREQLRAGVWIEYADALSRKAGEALWPEKYSAEDLQRIAANIGPYDYAALYRQQPFLRSGGFFQREWFVVIDELPSNRVRRVRYWDKAASKDGDYTAGVLMSKTADGFVIIEDVVVGRWTPGERDEQMKKTGVADKGRPGPMVTQWHQQDPGSAGVDSAMATNRYLANAGVHARFEPLTGNKEIRAEGLSSAAQGGMVRLLRGAWNARFLDEAASFPKGAHDDQVDAASTAFNKLAAGGKGIWVD